MKKFSRENIFIYALIILFVSAISYFATAGIFYILCRLFNWEFSFKAALGVWIILFIINISKTTK